MSAILAPALIALWLINIAICVSLGVRNGRPVLGAVLGIFISSLVGIIIMILIPPKTQRQEPWGFKNWKKTN